LIEIDSDVIYRSVSPVLYFRDYTCLRVRVRVVSVPVSVSGLHRHKPIGWST